MPMRLEQIENALVDAILASSEAELREEIRSRGEDPDKIIAQVDSTIEAAKQCR